MTKSFKLRISKVIPSFQSCRSKDPSTLPDHPVPPFLRLSTVVTPPATTKQHHRSSFKSHVSSAFIIGCGFGSKSGDRQSDDLDFQWQEDEEWHVVAKIYDETPRRKIYNSSVSGHDSDEEGILPLPLPLQVPEKKKRRGKKTRTKLRHLSKTSSDETTFGFDEREGEEGETETLVSSSRSFSADSSTDFNPQLETIRESAPIPRPNKKKTKKQTKRATGHGGGGMKYRSSTECSSPARLSEFTKLIPSCKVEGKVKESFAVVKKSEDPYEDFKRSMMEMIVEKQMFEERDLEQLLQCFLSLNSRYHHGVIVEAFAEIWNTMFHIPRISCNYELRSRSRLSVI